jgi:hypothetical protein
MVAEKDKLQSDSLGRRRHRHGRNSEVERTLGMLSSSAPSEEVERAPGCSPADLHRHLDWVRFVEAEMHGIWLRARSPAPRKPLQYVSSLVEMKGH